KATAAQGVGIPRVMKKRGGKSLSERGNGPERRTLSNHYFSVKRRRERERDFPPSRRTLSNRCFSGARSPSSERENGLERPGSCDRVNRRSLRRPAIPLPTYISSIHYHSPTLD